MPITPFQDRPRHTAWRGVLFLALVIAVFEQSGTFTQTGTTLQLHGSSSELSSTADGGAVVPAVGPVGTLRVTGTGGPVFGPVGAGTGVAFLDGDQQVDNTSYYSFNGTGVGSLFNLSS